MSKEIPCSHCQFPNTVEVWSLIQVQEDPELKELLLGGEINMAECESCHKIFYAEHFLLYHDPNAELMAFVYPYSYREEKEIHESKTKSDFQEFKDSLEKNHKVFYEPYTLFGLDELVRMVEWDDEVALQSEIAKILAEQSGLKTKSISFFMSRELKLPLVLPYDMSTIDPLGALRLGFEKIVQMNDRLSVYSETKKFLDKGLPPGLHFESL